MLSVVGLTMCSLIEGKMHVLSVVGLTCVVE